MRKRKPILKPNQVSKKGRRYPVRHDKVDKRDKLMRAVLPPKPLNMPSSFDLLDHLGPVRDQGNLGACTGFAYAGIREFLSNIPQSRTGTTSQPLIFSPMYLYYRERAIEGDVDEDSGAEPRDGCKVLLNFGVCQETKDAYDPASFTTAPTPEMDADAAQYKIHSYHRIANLDELKQTIFQGSCASIGMDVYDSFEGNDLASTGNMPMPSPTENLLGGHEVFAFGYDDNHQNVDGSKGAIHIRNSWGTGWGENGNFWMPYQYVVPKYVSDIWVPVVAPK